MSVTPIPWFVNEVETTGLIGAQPGVLPGETDDYTFGFPGGPTGRQAHSEIIEYTHNAGQYVTYESIDGEFYFREQSPNEISPLVHIVPGNQDPTGVAIWGLIESYEDPTTFSRSRLQLSLSVFVLARGSEYTSESDLRADLEVHGP